MVGNANSGRPAGTPTRRPRKTMPDDVREALTEAVERVRTAEFANDAEKTRRAGLALADAVEKAILDLLERPMGAPR